ncbi:FtsQ-type POTRA domain-containing protein [Ruminococcus sp.]|uniref:cell division protein FtsQ/DivIB n=1 Tax=Ruminococcus sp. TaxID=41978 RepID=UPI003520A841
MAEDKRKELSAEERRKIQKQRKQAAKEAQKYHKSKEKAAKSSSGQKKKSSANKQNDAKNRDEIKKPNTAPSKKKTSAQKSKSTKSEKKPEKKSHSQIEQKLNEQMKKQRDDLSKEERYIRKSEKKIKNLKPKAYDDGFYIDEFGERQKQQKVAQNIREQENEKVKRLKKPMTSSQIKKRRIMASVITCGVVLVIGIILSLTVLFKTEKIEIEGDSFYSEEQILSFANVALQSNIFVGKMTATPDKIAEKLPYVESAKVDFVIPDTIKITIQDAVPSYVIVNDGKFLLISSKGRILDVMTDNSSNYPVLSSSALQTTTIGDYVSYSDENVPVILEEISDSLSKHEFKGITGIDVTNTANIKLVYDNRIAVIIGLPEDIDYKIRTAMAIITEKLDPNKTGAIYGTLDVSSCSTNKTSRFNPNETIAVTTAPTGTVNPTQGTADASEPATTQGATLATNSNGEYIGVFPDTGLDIGNGILAFDTNGDGIADCFDTDGDGYADVFGSLNSSSDSGSTDNSDNGSNSYSDGSDGYNSGEPSEDHSTQYDDPNNSYL